MDSDGFFKSWAIFVVIIYLALAGVGIWAVFELVTWLTSK